MQIYVRLCGVYLINGFKDNQRIGKNTNKYMWLQIYAEEMRELRIMFGTPCSRFFRWVNYILLEQRFPNIFGHRILCNLVNIYGTQMFCGLSSLTLKPAQRDLLVTNSYMNGTLNYDQIC